MYRSNHRKKIIGDQVSMNCTKIVLCKQQIVFVGIHGIFPGSFTVIATNHEGTGRSTGIPGLLRSHGEFSTGWECTDMSTQMVTLAFGTGRADPWNMLVGWFLWDFCGSHFQWSMAFKGKKYFPAKHRIYYLFSGLIDRLPIKSFFSQKMSSFLVFSNAKNFLGCMIIFQGNDEFSSLSVIWR